MESPPARNEFQIGWICALPIEAAAAIQMLDENFGILQEQERTDTNTYTLGRIGHHHVVIACLPDGQYGTTSATTVANNMLRTFSDSLRIGLMVGIGGGAPSVEHDIRLGDIVISRPEGSHGGVIQYDMGKIGKNGIFQRIGSLNSPPKSLLNALAQMRAAELYDDPQYPVYLQEAIGKNKRTQKTFYRPDVRSDRLFKIDYGHSEGVTCCDQCPAEWEEDRITREDGNPQTHYGTIASGNTLIKDGKMREAIRKDTGALCFEMEAAGLMADFPCLVVRGICDYADSHKNKQWQGYAALAAAAFTKELLGYVPKGVSQERLVADICPLLKDIKEGQRKAFDQRECHHREKMERALTENQRRCHQAFKTSTYEQYKDINPNRVKGTCEWVLKSSEYRRWWESSSNDLLWISADPGCGKSVLAKSLIDEVFHASTPTVSICYFFFKDNDEQNSLATALCAILHQLFGLQPHLLRYALPFWEKNREKIHQGVEDLWHIFMAAMSDPESVDTICVFDALDECRRSDQKQLIGKLQQYYTKHRLSPPRSSLKFLVTSRPYDEIEEDFQSIIELFPQIHLRGEEENDQIHDEISLVVKIRVSELGKQLKLKATTEARLEKVLLEMEHRTYLWLYLAIDDIRTMFKDSLRPDQESVPLIPKSVNEAYRKILDRVTPRQEATVKTILRIIVGARRPLTIMEMAMALGVATSKSARTVVEAKVDLEGLGEKIRRLCGLFVFINDSKIYLIHQTAREFLITNIDGTTRHKWHFLLIDIEKEMVEICARYLLMDDLTDREWQENVHGLLVYSAQHWPDHFREISSLKAELFELVYRLYDVNTERFALWFPVFWQSAMPFEEKPQMNELHLAAFNGHHSVIRRLAMSDEQAIDRPDTSGMNALQWASLRGHHKCVRLLLEKGAYVNAQGGKYGNALYAASLNGHVNIVQQLLEKRADVSAQCGLFGNALQAASFEGHIKIVQQLLTNGANVNAQGGVYGNALQATSFGGHIDIVQQLLLEGADVNAQGGFYGSTLQMASFKGYVDIVQLLLEKGVDVNAQGGDYGNSLQAASSGGHIDIVRKLLTNGANVNAQGGQFGNALQAASWRGHIDIVQQLLLEGADVNARGRSYPMIDGQSYPMIHRPVRRRPNHALQEYEMQLTLLGQQNKRRLMMAGQEQWLSDQRALGNSNALYAASAQGHIEIVRILLEKGAYVNAQGKYGNALYAASAQGHVEIVRILLEKGAYVNAQGGKYGNALYAASAQGHVEIVRILLEKGAYVNAQGGKYGNALYAASLKGHVDIVQVLQKYVSAKQKAQQTNTSHRRTRRIIDNPVQPKRRRIRN